jgi:hypothetical protein
MEFARDSLILMRPLATAFGLMLTIVGTARSATFTPLGDLPGSRFSSRASDVSADGSIIIGNSLGTSGNFAFIWDVTNGMRPVGQAPGVYYSNASAISADGLTLVGAVQSDAFRWNSGFGIQRLGPGRSPRRQLPERGLRYRDIGSWTGV